MKVLMFGWEFPPNSIIINGGQRYESFNVWLGIPS